VRVSAPTHPRTPLSPPALRARRPGWRDPRLVGGVVIVALSGLLGARLLAGADDSVRVWSVRHLVVAGQSLGSGDLVAARIRFAEAADADRYLSADESVPEGTLLRRSVGAGELLPRAALADGDESGLVELPVGVPIESVPASLEVGDLVDVWVTARGSELSVSVLSEVPVLALPLKGDSMSSGAERQVVLGLDRANVDLLPEALAQLADGTVVLTSRPGR